MKEKNRMRRFLLELLLLTITFTGQACTERGGNAARESSPGVSREAQGSTSGIPFYTYQVIRSWPHDPAAYTHKNSRKQSLSWSLTLLAHHMPISQQHQVWEVGLDSKCGPWL